MKKFLFIFFLILQNAFSQKNYTELKELGLHGNIESIITKSYSSKIDSTDLISKQTAIFNKKGNIIKVIDSIDESGKLKVAVKEYIESNEGTKSIFKIKIEGKLVEYGSYEWIDDRNYTITAFGDDAIKTEYRYYLDQNLRDSIGRTKYYLYDPKNYSTVEYLASSEYQNFYDQNGYLREVIEIDDLDNDKKVIIYETLDLDELGNKTKVKLFDKESDSLIEIRTTKYNYY